jgi:GT2 family glycosyltransferase
VISAIVPTLRGQARLDRNLGSVVAALEAAGEPWEVLVVDDGGGGIGALPAGVRLVALDENRGYGPAVNAGAAEARGDYFLILNDDVRLEPDCVRLLRGHLPGAGLFAVVPAILSPLAACGDEGGKAGRLRAGLIEIVEVPPSASRFSLYPVGCCYLCPSDGFRELGGYDDVFAPFFWEDVDIGYRAWRRGRRILHAPEAICHHEGSATISEQRSHAEREQIEFRNRALFHLRNLQERRLRAANHGAGAAHALFDGRTQRLEGLAEALVRYAKAGRRDEDGVSDEEILERVSGA